MWQTLDNYPSYEINEENQIRNKSSQRTVNPTSVSKKFLHYILCENGIPQRIKLPNPHPEIKKPRKEPTHRYEKSPSDLTLLKEQRWSAQRCYFHIETLNWLTEFQLKQGFPGRTIESLIKDGTVVYKSLEQHKIKKYMQNQDEDGKFIF